MGCGANSKEAPESPYNKCRTTITNINYSLLRLFPIKEKQLLAVTSNQFLILNLETKKSDVTCQFTQKISCAYLLRNPDLHLIIGKFSGEIEILSLHNKKDSILKGHSSKITFFTLLSSGLFCSASEDGDIFVWDLTNKVDEYNFSAQDGNITCLCELKDKRLVVISDSDATGKIFDLQKQTLDLVWPIDSPYYLIQLRDGRIVYGSEGDLLVYKINKLIDVEIENLDDTEKKKGKGPELTLIKAHNGIITMILELKTGEIATGGEDSLIKIWNPNYEFMCVKELDGHAGQLNHISENSFWRLFSCAKDGSIKIWSK